MELDVLPDEGVYYKSRKTPMAWWTQTNKG
jgi:hypothetical protein